MPEAKNDIIHIHDNPTSTDQLKRQPFAESLADIIINAPDSSSFRLGVYGDWGEGKTSVLLLMQTILQEKGVETALFLPWGSTNDKEMLVNLLYTISEALNLSEYQDVKDREKREENTQKVADVFRGFKESHWTLKAIGGLVDSALLNEQEKLKSWRSDVLLKAISEELSNKKLVIFVDDLDRLRAELLPDLLLNLRETLDLPNLYYVLALSPKIVQQGLKGANPSWEDPFRFLEKIVEYPAFLPKPSEDDLEVYIKANIGILVGVVDTKVLSDLVSFMPRNPRQVKLFLRFLSSLKGQLNRFDSEEIDSRSLYLCQLLRIEFPYEIRKIVEDEKLLVDVEIDLLLTLSSREPRLINEYPEVAYAPQDDEGKQRFINLFAALRKQTYHGAKYKLKQMFTLLESPPLLTRKELQILLEKFNQSSVEEKRNIIESWLNKADSLSIERTSKLLQMTIEKRDKICAILIDMETQEEMESLLPEIYNISEFLRCMFADLRITQKGLVSSEAWEELFNHLSRWAHFETPENIYGKLRSDEIGLLKLSLDEAAEELKEFAYKQLLTLFSDCPKHEHQSLPHLFLDSSREILLGLTVAIVKSILDLFRQPDGVSYFWAKENDAKKNILFDAGSPFYQTETIGFFLEIASSAHKDVDIQKNFLGFLKMIAYNLRESLTSFPSSAQEIVYQYDLIKNVWNAAVARPLNYRMVGDLRRIRQILLTKYEYTEESLLKPQWWQSIKDSGFFQDMGQPKSNE